MKRLVCICEDSNEAREVVARIMDNGGSAYRDGLRVYEDDGGYDDGYGFETTVLHTLKAEASYVERMCEDNWYMDED